MRFFWLGPEVRNVGPASAVEGWQGPSGSDRRGGVNRFVRPNE